MRGHVLFLALVVGVFLSRPDVMQAGGDGTLADSPVYQQRLPLRNGDGSLVTEFGIQGAPKQMLLRVIGPSFGGLADPTLELRNGER